MLLGPDLQTLPEQLATPAVRDLAWALVSPPLVVPAQFPIRHPLSASGWAQRPDTLADWLQQLDQQPSELLAFLAERRTQRLGRYYEALWQFALLAAPDLTLHLSQLQVIEQGRTLGELDAIIEDDEGLHHVEFAIKFYMGPTQGDGSNPHLWLGPDPRDSLGQKLDHLQHRQLRLTEQEPAQALLRQHGLTQPKPSAWLSGYLFAPITGCQYPQGAQANSHQWLHPTQWPEQEPIADWLCLPRSAWLSPAQAIHPALCRLLPCEHAQQLARLDGHQSPSKEIQRRFLMPTTWPRL